MASASHVFFFEVDRPRIYLFEVAQPFEFDTGICRPGEPQLGNAFVTLDPEGVLRIAAGYAWDGASGPIAQTPDVIRGSLVHDGLYQLMRECGLPAVWRATADDLLRAICISDGMPRWQAALVHAAVDTFGARHARPPKPRQVRQVRIAPVPVTLPSTSDWSAP